MKSGDSIGPASAALAAAAWRNICEGGESLALKAAAAKAKKAPGEKPAAGGENGRQCQINNESS